jgi:ATP-dependent DNA ligase
VYWKVINGYASKYFMEQGMSLDEAKKNGLLLKDRDPKFSRILIKVGETKGITDAVQEDIRENRDSYVGVVVQVKSQGIINKETGSLRHPRWDRWRFEKDPKACTFEAHIRKDEEL